MSAKISEQSRPSCSRRIATPTFISNPVLKSKHFHCTCCVQYCNSALTYCIVNTYSSKDFLSQINQSFLYPIIKMFGFTLPTPERPNIAATPVWRLELSATEQNPLMLVNRRYRYAFCCSLDRLSNVNRSCSSIELVKAYNYKCLTYLDDISADHQGIIFTDEIGKVYESRTSVIFFSYIPNDFYCRWGFVIDA